MILTLALQALGGAIAVNTLPHLVAGLQGRRFPSPFGSPPGRGLSSPRLNVAWGMINLAAAWALLGLAAPLAGSGLPGLAATCAGALLGGLGIAGHFEKVAQSPADEAPDEG